MKEMTVRENFEVSVGDPPNVVSSGAAASDGRHYVAPLRFAGELAWGELEAVVGGFAPRVRVVESDGVGWLRAECRSLLLRFVDDLWLKREVGSGVIEVKSASRLGYSDLGVNRRRVERLRAVLNAL
ncbi:MAG: DUF1499 domain-containing protein [Verrucomicrobiales bacterium]|nr:DUF1499 domain-containing protein [Verrucomicrobiales bacterium]